MIDVSITVNGRAHKRKIAATLLLVDFLRDELDLTGTHIGCDTAQCGTCVVHVDGNSVKACNMLAAQADGKSVTTIEGLSEGSDLHPVQAAFREAHALQCGYCTPGMVMSAADLLQKTPSPSEQEIRTWLKGNICRCTGYHNIVKAVQAAATKTTPSA